MVLSLTVHLLLPRGFLILSGNDRPPHMAVSHSGGELFQIPQSFDAIPAG
jgi:hypothetical protein